MDIMHQYETNFLTLWDITNLKPLSMRVCWQREHPLASARQSLCGTFVASLWYSARFSLHKAPVRDA
jgi:hypothetical protein